MWHCCSNISPQVFITCLSTKMTLLCEQCMTFTSRMCAFFLPFSPQHHHDYILHSARARVDASVSVDLQSGLDQHPCGWPAALRGHHPDPVQHSHPHWFRSHAEAPPHARGRHRFKGEIRHISRSNFVWNQFGHFESLGRAFLFGYRDHLCAKAHCVFFIISIECWLQGEWHQRHFVRKSSSLPLLIKASHEGGPLHQMWPVKQQRCTEAAVFEDLF